MVGQCCITILFLWLNNLVDNIVHEGKHNIVRAFFALSTFPVGGNRRTWRKLMTVGSVDELFPRRSDV